MLNLFHSPGFAQLIHSPSKWVVEPMQVKKSKKISFTIIALFKASQLSSFFAKLEASMRANFKMAMVAAKMMFFLQIDTHNRNYSINDEVGLQPSFLPKMVESYLRIK